MCERLNISGEVFRIVSKVSGKEYASGMCGGDDLAAAYATNRLFDIASKGFVKVAGDDALVVEYLNCETESDEPEWQR